MPHTQWFVSTNFGGLYKTAYIQDLLEQSIDEYVYDSDQFSTSDSPSPIKMDLSLGPIPFQM